jgi:hypothetical protein
MLEFMVPFIAGGASLFIARLLVEVIRKPRKKEGAPLPYDLLKSAFGNNKRP